MAGEPHVRFDTAGEILTRDVTEFAPKIVGPNYVPREGTRIIEAHFDISARMIGGSENALTELVFEVASDDRVMRIIDFDPDTRLESLYSKDIEVTHTVEKRRSADVTLGGAFKLAEGPAATVTPSGTIGAGHRDATTKTIAKRPPLKTVIVSGTMDAGYGVFVKMKQTPHVSLEGVKQIVCRFEVPYDWQAGQVSIRCGARGYRKHYWSKRIESCGRGRFVVELRDPAVYGGVQTATPPEEKKKATAEPTKTVADPRDDDPAVAVGAVFPAKGSPAKGEVVPALPRDNQLSQFAHAVDRWFDAGRRQILVSGRSVACAMPLVDCPQNGRSAGG